MILLTADQQGNPRTTSLLAVAKENGLEIEFVDTEPAKGVSADYLKLNKLGKVPTFEGADGFVLSECIAIAVYCKYAKLPFRLPVK
jgi:elongation factor 1-gamma